MAANSVGRAACALAAMASLAVASLASAGAAAGQTAPAAAPNVPNVLNAAAAPPLVATTWRSTVEQVTGAVLYHPAATDSAPATSYTRVIRLAHGAANGRLLATFEHHGSGGFPLHESRDDGQSWSAAPVATVRGAVHGPASGWRLEWQPTLYELPAGAGDLPAGTILLAGNDVNFADVQNDALELYASTDVGRTWRYRGTIESSPPRGGGVWEPELRQIDGRLVAYYSSERHKDRGYNQLLAHRVSADGGRTWGAEVFDVAVPDRVHRPGMAVVSRLPNGRYVMSYEVCAPAGCPAAVKISRDGLHWGDPADLGRPVRTADGVALLGTPYNAWVPAGGLAGGPAGALVVSAHDVDGVAGRRVLLVSRDPTRGAWRAVPAPVQWQGGNDHAGWSNALIPTADGRGLLHLVSSAVGDGTRNEIRYATAPMQALMQASVQVSVGAASRSDSFANPIVRSEPAGDPWVVRDGGWYYFTATMGPGRGVWVWRSRTLTGLDAGTKVRVWTAPDSGPTSRQIWAPELHRLRGRWYLYFTASDGVDAHHRLYVAAARTDDPLGAYDPPARVDPTERYAIDGSVLAMPDGRLYFLYCANGVYIAPMTDPTRVGGPAVQIIRGTEPWEHEWLFDRDSAGGRWRQGAGYWVEAPEPLLHGGRVFLTYSAGHTATPHYYLGLLSLTPGGDPLDPNAWTKRHQPVFAPYVGPEGAVYTPGHNGFTTSPDRTEDWLVYHAKDGGADATGGNDYSPRTVRAQRFTWNADGTPQFGHPVPSGVLLRKPSGGG